MNENNMSEEQYNDLVKSLSSLAGEIEGIHHKIDKQGTQVQSILLWIKGNQSPNDMPMKGADAKITKLEERVFHVERSVESIKRIDDLEMKVDNNEVRLQKIWTIVGVIATIASIVGVLSGIFIPPLLG